jgi:DNA-binding transcriptional regulator YhcF (GntR family)
MKITIETDLKKNKKTVDSLDVILETEEIVNIVRTKGVAVANKALDKFIAKYTEDLKKKLSGLLMS